MTEKRDKEITAESLNIKVDKAGNVRIKLFVNAEGTPTVSFLDLEGKERLGMNISEDGNPFLGFYGPDGKAIRALP